MHPAYADERKDEREKDADGAHHAVGGEGNTEKGKNGFHILQVCRAYAQNVFVFGKTDDDVGIGGVGGKF